MADFLAPTGRPAEGGAGAARPRELPRNGQHLQSRRSEDPKGCDGDRRPSLCLSAVRAYCNPGCTPRGGLPPLARNLTGVRGATLTRCLRRPAHRGVACDLVACVSSPGGSVARGVRRLGFVVVAPPLRTCAQPGPAELSSSENPKSSTKCSPSAPQDVIFVEVAAVRVRA